MFTPAALCHGLAKNSPPPDKIMTFPTSRLSCFKTKSHCPCNVHSGICCGLKMDVLTLRSTWKVWIDFSRLFIGTSMSCTTWCCSYSFRIASPWVSFNKEIFGGTIQPNR